MCNKLEVTYEGTTKVNDARISSLVNEYELFKITNDRHIIYVFSRFSNIVCEQNHLEKSTQMLFNSTNWS